MIVPGLKKREQKLNGYRKLQLCEKEIVRKEFYM